MSKERLEEIETQLNRFMTPANKMVLLRDDAEWLIKYAKEQAERVQELEKDRENMKELIMERHGTVGKWIDKCGNLEQQNKRYREVIGNIKKTSKDFREGHLLDIQDSYFVDEIIAIIKALESETE